MALAVSTALFGASCNAERQDTTTPYSNHGTTHRNYQSGDELPSFQSKYAITFTNFRINKADESFANPDSEYLFYVYSPEKSTYEFKCFNDIGDCKNVWVSAKKGNTIPLNVKVSEFADSGYVYLMVLEAEFNYWEGFKHTFTDQIKWVRCPQQRKLFGKIYANTCQKIPVQYLLDNRSSCLKMATYSGSDEICLSYEIEALQKLHPDFQKNLEQLSALSGLLDSSYPEWVKFFKKDPLYNQEKSVQFVDFSKRDEVKNQSVSSVTFYAPDKYARDKKFSNLPTKIAQPVVNYLARQYPNALWVINGAYGKVLAAYGANQLNQAGHSSPIRIRVNWPPSVSHQSINDWLKTPEKNQARRPYHTLGLFYQRGGDNAKFAVERGTGLSDTVDTVSDTLTLPGRYTLGTHLNIDKDNVELSGIFSLFNSEVTGNEVSGYSIKLTPKYEQKVKAKLELPSGYEYRYKKDCRSIKKTVSKWFATDKVTLQCPRLPQSRIVPEFVNGEVRLEAQNKELSLGLRFKNRAQSQSSLEGWHLKGSQITLSQTHQGQDNWMLINARDLPEPTNGHLTLEPPADAVSIFYRNEPIPVKLSKVQQKYLYTAKPVPDLEGYAVVEVDVPNPKERLVETFKNSDNPWTPETLKFLCDGSQSDTSLCNKTCRLDSTTAQNHAKLICQGKPVTMPLKQLEGYLVTTRFIGERWGTPRFGLKANHCRTFSVVRGSGCFQSIIKSLW
ncbi:MAG: hypothetical protein DRR19_00520 [Candidatus Parabeggiatoa sp. nov. 1]|nr:MAG: hypothetical protein DRR19_00520 [Gammaproteobacteria bacterium]